MTTSKVLTVLALSVLLVGCAKKEMVYVRCVAVHIYGDTIKKTGVMNEHFTYMTAERLDTLERRNFVEVLGRPNEIFVMDWNAEHYSQ